MLAFEWKAVHRFTPLTVRQVMGLFAYINCDVQTRCSLSMHAFAIHGRDSPQHTFVILKNVLQKYIGLQHMQILTIGEFIVECDLNA